MSSDTLRTAQVYEACGLWYCPPCRRAVQVEHRASHLGTDIHRYWAEYKRPDVPLDEPFLMTREQMKVEAGRAYAEGLEADQ